jgi:outer membrane protein OmpA-like peptidoglycan-associated protein
MYRFLPVSVCLLVALCQPCGAQMTTPGNLVPNGGFEYLAKKPKGWMANKYEFHETMALWTSPNLGSPDVLLNEQLPTLWPPRPHVSMSGYRARSGNTMVGIKTWGCGQRVMHCKEFIQVKLTEPLRPGSSYELELWVSVLQNGVKANKLGAGFSSHFLADATAQKLAAVKPVAYFKEIVSPGKNEWLPLRQTFTADSSWQYLLIGNFFPDDSTSVDTSQADIPYAYYLIDDVSLRKINSFQNLNPDAASDSPIILDAVYFETDKAELLPGSHTQLLDLASWLKNHPSVRIEIAGHTDNIADEAYNLALSQKRAQAVADFLVENGIDPDRLSVAGYGEKYPVAPNDTDEGRQKNRRVEIKILK